MRPLLALLAAVAVGVAIGLAVLARGDDLPPPAAVSTGDGLTVRTAVEPRTALFGEPVTAVTELLVDPARVRPDTVRLEAQVEPFALVAARRIETRAGGLVRVVYRYRLGCTTAACLPDGRSREIELDPGQVFYNRREGTPGASVRLQENVSWPSFTVVSRVSELDVERARWRADLADLPAVTERASPAILGAALLGGSALLALLGIALIGSQLGLRRPAAEVEEAAPAATPLERALAGVTSSSPNGGGDDRRRSLERLARELSATGRGELAARARRLAWSPRALDADAVDALAGDVRALIEEQR